MTYKLTFSFRLKARKSEDSQTFCSDIFTLSLCFEHLDELETDQPGNLEWVSEQWSEPSNEQHLQPIDPLPHFGHAPLEVALLPVSFCFCFASVPLLFFAYRPPGGAALQGGGIALHRRASETFRSSVGPLDDNSFFVISLFFLDFSSGCILAGFTVCWIMNRYTKKAYVFLTLPHPPLQKKISAGPKFIYIPHGSLYQLGNVRFFRIDRCGRILSN